MPTKLVLVPVKLASKASKALANTLSQKLGYRVFRVRPNRVKKRIAFRFRPGTDKLSQFQAFKAMGVSSPNFTTSIEDAKHWLAEGKVVVCRRLLRGSEGKGIVIATKEDELVHAPLYTEYIKKKKEFRVHVFNGAVIDVQEKRKKGGFDGERNTRVRNVSNGYVFCRGDIREPADLRDVAVAAANAIGYSLGAVDVVYNERSDKSYVLEVNATPGMEGTTLNNYADNILEWYKEQVR
jgi:Glutathione synthase/Ribosomal protein S6 modification enzyme (glutaminyl transferase)